MKISNGGKNMTSYEQKYLFEKRIFTIGNDGVNMRKISIQDDFEDFVHFEEISTKVLHLKQTVYMYLCFGIFFLAISVMFLIGEIGEKLSWQFLLFFSCALIFGLAFMFGYLKESVPSKYIECGQWVIPFFYRRQHRADVDQFIENIIDARNAYLKNKLLNVDETVSYFVYLDRLRWLKDEEIVENEEYELLKEQFLQRFRIDGEVEHDIGDVQTALLN
jgi:hypothetical protein